VVIPELITFVCVLEGQIILHEWLEQRSLRYDLPVAMLVSRSFSAINLSVAVVLSRARRLVGVVVYKLNSKQHEDVSRHLKR
jgi:hypothetical protein